MIRQLLPLGLLALASCSPPPPPPEPAVQVAVADPQPEPRLAPKTDTPQPTPKVDTPVVPVQPKKDEPPPPPPPTFQFPKDEAGKLLPNVVRPTMPPAPAIEKFGTAPKLRASSNKMVEPDPLPKLVHSTPPLAPAKPVAAAPTAPPERVPLDLGFGASAVPARPAFPEAPGIAIQARDVKLPPDLVPLGRQTPDRASLDDPTAEPGNAVIVTKSPVPALGIAWFLKVALPDPFELTEHVKPKVAPMAEPTAAPVVVNPQRPK